MEIVSIEEVLWSPTLKDQSCILLVFHSSHWWCILLLFHSSLNLCFTFHTDDEVSWLRNTEMLQRWGSASPGSPVVKTIIYFDVETALRRCQMKKDCKTWCLCELPVLSLFCQFHFRNNLTCISRDFECK